MKKLYPSAALAALAACLCWLPAKAQQPDTVRSLDEIVVTATKFPRKLAGIGKVVRVISAAELDRSRGKTLPELLGEQAGINVIGSGSNPGGNKSLSLRGAGAGYTLVLLDGVPLTDPSDIAGVFDLRLINLEEIERIEILKGGQSTLYGSDAVAGVVNLITKKAGARVLSAGATISAGSLGSKRINVDLDGRISKNLTYRTSYTHFQTNGIAEAVDNGSDSVNHGHFHRNGYSQNALLAKLSFTPGSAIIFTPYFRLTANRGTYANGAFMDGALPYKLRALTGGFNSSFNLKGAGTIYVTEGYTYTQRYFSSPYGAYGYTGRFNQAEAYYTRQLSPHLQLIAGLSEQHEGTLDSVSKTRQAEVNILSPYASFFLKNMHGINLDLGARMTHHTTFGNNYTWNINPSYSIDSTVKLFVNASSAFKAPTLFELYAGGYGNIKLKSERSVSFDAGLTLFPGKSFTLDAVVYQRIISNEITFFNNKYNNLNRQNNRGIEIEPAITPVAGLNLKAFYALILGKVTTKGASGKDTTYDKIIRIPRNSFGLSAGYQVSKALYLSMNFRSYQHRTDQDFSVYPGIALVNLKGYSQLDGYAEYTFYNNRLKIFAQLYNILNARFTEVYGYSTLGFHTEIGLHFNI